MILGVTIRVCQTSSQSRRNWPPTSKRWSPVPSKAETASDVKAVKWNDKRLRARTPSCHINAADDEIAHEQLFQLAEVDRSESTDRSILELLWNTMAWGISGDWRNVDTMMRFIYAPSSPAAAALRQAQKLSLEGENSKAYASLNQQIPKFGPAFFTKFLFFTSDPGCSRPRALISGLPALRSHGGSSPNEWRDLSKRHYARYCLTMHEWSLQLGMPASQLEGLLFEFRRQGQDSPGLADPRSAPLPRSPRGSLAAVQRRSCELRVALFQPIAPCGLRSWLLARMRSAARSAIAELPGT